MKKILTILVSTILGFIILIGIFLKYEEFYFLPNNILKINETPSSLEILEHKEISWTDYRAEYIISINANEYDKLFLGRNYSEDNVTGTSKDVSSLLENHKSFKVVKRYHSKDPFKNISVNIYTSADQMKLAIIYDVY